MGSLGDTKTVERPPVYIDARSPYISISRGDFVFCKETNYYIIYSYIVFYYFFRKYTVLNWKFCKICSF